MNVLLTSAGRRVALVRAFRRAIQGRGQGGRVMTADLDPTAPALYTSDKGFVVPPVSSSEYVKSVKEICRQEKVRVIVPLIDPELPVIAAYRAGFVDAGVVAVISSFESVMIGHDKLETARFFARHGIPSPCTFTPPEAWKALEEGLLDFPVIVKPRDGSSAQGITVCTDEEELAFHLTRRPDLIVQEFLQGDEVTIDLFGDGSGKLVAAIPRKRLKVRAGEVERALTLDDAPYREHLVKIARHLKPFGPMNVQCFLSSRAVVFTEINPRFGGGYPLADAAGAQFPELVLDLVDGRPLVPRLGKYQKGLVMARFDEALFVPEEDLLRSIK